MKLLRIAVVLAVLSGVVSSCQKNSLIGLGVLPASDDVGAVFTDTFTLITSTIRDDSVLTSSTVNNVAGTMFDPVFGKTYGAFFTELRLPTNEVDFGSPDTLYVDSVVLALGYGGYYGYQNVPQTLNVYRVTEAMNPKPDNGYFSNKAFAFDSDPIGSKENFVPDFVDSVTVLNFKLPAHLRIRLSDRFGQELLSHSGDSTIYANDSTFKNFLKGICVAPDTIATPYGGSIVYFDLLSLLSGLHLYWHTPHIDSLSFVFPITTDEVKTNFFLHNYSGSEVAPYLQNHPASGDSVVFVQGMAGLKTRIMIPALANLKNVLINKAELVITQQYDPGKSDSIYKAPPQIVCVTQDSTGKDVTIPDNFDLFPSFGGTSVTFSTLDRNTYVEYHFSVADQLQRIIDGTETDRGLFLIVFKRGESADRLRAGGSLRVDNLKMKLNLIYTPIP